MHYEGLMVRVYPKGNQVELAWKHIGACRYIWNYMLDLEQTRYENGETYLGAYSMNKLLKPLKNDGVHSWLKEISNTSLKLVCRDLDVAYQRFFDKLSGHPKFKSRKKSKTSFPVRSENTAFYFYNDKYVVIPKLGKVRYRTDHDIPIGRKVCKFYNVHMFYDNNKWYISFSMECENQVLELTDKTMGIDLGIKELAVAAIDGEQIIYHNINKSKQMRKLVEKQKFIQRSISRKYEQNKVGNRYNKTKNIIREEEKLRKVYRRMKNIRDNYINQITHDLVSMLPKRVVMEDLNVHCILRNRHLSKAAQEECLYKFRECMRYKCAWNGIEFVLADRFYPSSKTCSCCGNVKKDLKLSDRTYVCPKCGFAIDRDFNAALNLSRYEV